MSCSIFKCRPMYANVACVQAERASACYVAIGNYIAMSSNELTVHKGELLEMITDDTDEWVMASLPFLLSVPFCTMTQPDCLCTIQCFPASVPEVARSLVAHNAVFQQLCNCRRKGVWG